MNKKIILLSGVIIVLFLISASYAFFNSDNSPNINLSDNEKSDDLNNVNDSVNQTTKNILTKTHSSQNYKNKYIGKTMAKTPVKTVVKTPIDNVNSSSEDYDPLI